MSLFCWKRPTNDKHNVSSLADPTRFPAGATLTNHPPTNIPTWPSATAAEQALIPASREPNAGLFRQRPEPPKQPGQPLWRDNLVPKWDYLFYKLYGIDYAPSKRAPLKLGIRAIEGVQYANPANSSPGSFVGLQVDYNTPD